MKKKCPLCETKTENIIKYNDLFRVVLVEDIPGFVRVVLNEHISEITDLDFNSFQKISAEIYKIERIMRKILNPDKINIASLGNYVPHLHFHIIPRYKEDSWFPDSIWSEKHREYEYKTTKEQLDKMVKEIKKLKTHS